MKEERISLSHNVRPMDLDTRGEKILRDTHSLEVLQGAA